ncbi:MAG: PorP/SprF family type IX secretion system membrane protein, partial [Chitinophagaceae bacterium]
MKLYKTIQLIIAFITVFCTCTYTEAQDLHFSQFFEAPLWRNPSLAGIFNGDIRVQAVYRDQWNSITNAYKTGCLNTEFKLPVGKNNDFITTGLQIIHDKAGTIGWTSAHVLPVLNYHKSLNNERNQFLSLGFMGGIVQRRIDLSKATTNSQYDNGGLGENISNAQYIYADGSVGLSYNSILGQDLNNNFYLGAAYHHFNRPNKSFYRNANIELHPKLVFSAGFRFGVSDFAYMTVQADQSLQGGFKETIGGAMYGLKIGNDPDNP